jgi:Tol biopolymer transport system component
MAPSEWNQVVELFHAALEKSGNDRVALLDEACGSETLIRKAVEELLKEHESDDHLLSDSPWTKTARAPCPDVIGRQQRFERFVLLEMLGRGGMGEVWSARDTELDRLVALKFLPAETGLGVDMAHIAHEAKAASALNHPNIVTIHEVVRSGGCSAMVMELVEGRSLAKLRGTLLPIAEVLSIGLQIAKALAAAHAHGIIHGDIKPENIMLREDGYVKVLDFGLARRVAMESMDAAAGPVGGTLRYMSPEQAKGEALAPGSDMFSFGLVLSELASGKRSFADKSPREALAATLRHDLPAPASQNPRVPAALNSLIVAMLAKDVARRPSAEEAARQLSELSRPGTGRVTLWLSIGAASVLVVAASWFFFTRQDIPQFSNLRIEPLTSQTGWEAHPAFSPDGQAIAFTWTDRLENPPQIYVKQPGDTAPTRLTDPHSEGQVGPLVWSPDGKQIAFKRRYNASGGGLFAISSSGGSEKKIRELRNPQFSARIDWSPDGTLLAFSDVLPEYQRLAIFVMNLRTGKERALTFPKPDEAGDLNPKFSPDGRSIAFKRVSGFWADDIYTVPVAGGEPRRVTWDRRGIWGHAWTADGKSLILSCQRGSTIFGLWRFPFASPGHPERIVQGGVDAITPATCWKTKQLAWVSQTQDLNIYRVPFAGGEEPVRIIGSTLRDQQPAYSSSGQIAFVSDRSGSREIWLARDDGSGQKRVTNFEGPDVGDLQWSPDGRRLAFYGRAQGHSDIFVLDCDGARMLCGTARRVISGIKAEVPSWSADGASLYFASDRSGQWEVWRQAVSGGQPVKITNNGGYAAREARDGKWLYFSKDGKEALWRIPRVPGEQAGVSEELVIGSPNHVEQKGWTLIPDGIVFTEPPENGHPGALRFYQFSSKRTRQILPSMEGFPDGREYGVSVSPDMKWVLYSQLDRSGSNVMVAESR